MAGAASTGNPRAATTVTSRRQGTTDQELGSAATTTSMKMRGVPAPAPIKTMKMTDYFDAFTTPPEVVDTASWSPPSTPSDSASSDGSPPAHGGALSAFHHTPEAALTPPSLHPQMATPHAPPAVVVRRVWQHNFAQEAALIEALLPRFRYAAVDTEFPGTVYRPTVPAYLLTPEKRYALLKANVDELELIQLGLTLFDPHSPTAAVTWEFNLREFDPLRHRHAADSIAMLRARGLEFAATRRHGVRAPALGARLRKWLRAGIGRAGVVTFSGGYDVAYLVKAMFGSGYKLPAAAAEFEGVAAALLGRGGGRLFDVKQMARYCAGDLRGGLDAVAAKLGVARGVGEAHQAGSDSLLTCHAFVRMKERYFYDDDRLNTIAGMLTEITAF